MLSLLLRSSYSERVSSTSLPSLRNALFFQKSSITLIRKPCQKQNLACIVSGKDQNVFIPFNKNEIEGIMPIV